VLENSHRGRKKETITVERASRQAMMDMTHYRKK
jgi:hypothetical protein